MMSLGSKELKCKFVGATAYTAVLAYLGLTSAVQNLGANQQLLLVLQSHTHTLPGTRNYDSEQQSLERQL